MCFSYFKIKVSRSNLVKKGRTCPGLPYSMIGYYINDVVVKELSLVPQILQNSFLDPKLRCNVIDVDASRTENGVGE